MFHLLIGLILCVNWRNIDKEASIVRQSIAAAIKIGSNAHSFSRLKPTNHLATPQLVVSFFDNTFQPIWKNTAGRYIRV